MFVYMTPLYKLMREMLSQETLADMDTISKGMFELFSTLSPSGALSVAAGVVNISTSEINDAADQEIVCPDCKDACCCYQLVDCTEVEAAHAYFEAMRNGHQIDMARLKAQTELGDDADVYWQGPVETRRCVFLRDDNTCACYDTRPLNCRLHALAKVEGARCSYEGTRNLPYRVYPVAEAVNMAFKTHMLIQEALKELGTDVPQQELLLKYKPPHMPQRLWRKLGE